MNGGILWMTGLSGAGKSTLATSLTATLAARTPARPVELLDGDEVRGFLSAGLGFSRIDRDINVSRMAFVARLLARHGVLAIVAAISPYAATRALLRAASQRQGHPFLEVFVDAPLDVVIARDVKGLYKRALAGELPSFTGISDPYEPPAAPDLLLRTDRMSPAECQEALLGALEAHGLLSAAPKKARGAR